MMKKYGVWLLGENEEGFATPFEFFLEDFERLEAALHFAKSISSVSRINDFCPLEMIPSNIRYIRVVVEECEYVVISSCDDYLGDLHYEYVFVDLHYEHVLDLKETSSELSEA